jgi:hypothetical protein
MPFVGPAKHSAHGPVMARKYKYSLRAKCDMEALNVDCEVQKFVHINQ